MTIVSLSTFRVYQHGKRLFSSLQSLTSSRSSKCKCTYCSCFNEFRFFSRTLLGTGDPARCNRESSPGNRFVRHSLDPVLNQQCPEATSTERGEPPGQTLAVTFVFFVCVVRRVCNLECRAYMNENASPSFLTAYTNRKRLAPAAIDNGSSFSVPPLPDRTQRLSYRTLTSVSSNLNVRKNTRFASNVHITHSVR